MHSLATRQQAVQSQVEQQQECLSRAWDMLEKAELYEDSVPVSAALVKLLVAKQDYKALSAAYLRLHKVYDKLEELQHSPTRLLGTYYRVGFYGKKFGARLDNTQLVYKTPKLTQLSEIVQALKHKYAAQLGPGSHLAVLPDSNPVDTSVLDIANSCYLQITHLVPFFEDEDTNTILDSMLDAASACISSSTQLGATVGGRSSKEWLDKHSNLSAFQFTSSFTLPKPGGGGGPVQARDVYTRKTVIFTAHTFPWVATAQRIVGSREVVLEPIEAATQDINSRSQKLLQLVLSKDTSQKELQLFLSGAVFPQVHGGIRETCETWLPSYTPSSTVTTYTSYHSSYAHPANVTTTATATHNSHPAYNTTSSSSSSSSFSSSGGGRSRHLSALQYWLCLAVQKFLRACEIAVQKHGQLLSKDSKEDQKFHETLEYRLDKLCTQIAVFTHGVEQGMPPTQTTNYTSSSYTHTLNHSTAFSNTEGHTRNNSQYSDVQNSDATGDNSDASTSPLHSPERSLQLALTTPEKIRAQNPNNHLNQ